MSNLTLSQYIAMPAGEGERISFNGLDIVFKSTARQENGWTVLEYTLPARQFGAPYHYHKELTESFYIVEGEAWFRLGDEEYNLGAGSFVLVPPGTLHAFANRSDRPVRFLAHASNGSHKAFLKELFAMVLTEPVWPPSDPSKIIALGRRYDTEYV